MYNVILFCAAGMSTSLLVNKMEEAAKNEGFECEINAYPLSQVQNYATTADAILLGPQVRHKLNDIQKEAGDIPAEVIDMVSYGMMDGKKVIEQVKKMLNI